MDDTLKTSMLDACRRFIRPLARLLLRYGIGYREFAEMCKECFVDVAAEEFGLRGRPTNLSRISVATGVSRKEVRRIRSGDRGAQPVSYGLAPASLVLRGWYSDPEFLTPDGQPRALRVDGAKSSVATLVSRYAGDVTSGSVVAELSRFGLIEWIDDERIRPLSPYFMPPQADGQLFAAGAFSIRNLIATIAYNANPNHTGAPLFERYAWSSRLPDATRAAAHRLVVERGSELLSFFDRWLREHETTAPVGDDGPHDVGIGIYYFDDSKR